MSVIAQISLEKVASGTEFFFQSKKIEEIFKDLSKGKTMTLEQMGDVSDDIISFKAAPAYICSRWPTMPSQAKVWGNFSQGLLLQEGQFNMRFLTFVGLTEGVKLKFAKPFPKQALKTIIESAQTTIKEFLVEFGSSVKGNLTFTTQD